MPLGWVLLCPGPAAADGLGTITGQVVNRTASGGSVAGLEVRLLVVRNQAPQEERRTATDAEGSFRFAGLETSSEYAYQVITAYAGVPYGTGALTFSPDEGQKSVQMQVYETTEENPGLSVERASLIIAGADPETETVVALEMVEMVNPSDRTFRPAPGGPQGPMGLVRFSLPPGATDLTAHLGMAQEEMLQVDRGFATVAPLRPGSQEFMYAYRFPYQGGQVSFSKNLLYGARVFTLLAVEGAGDITSPLLIPRERAEIQGRSYQHFEGKDLPPDTAIQVSLSGLPQRSGLRLPWGEAPPPVWAGAGVALALAVLALVAVRRPNSVSTGALREREGPAQEVQALLEELADLDDRHAAGQVEDQAYREQRDALRNEVKSLAREYDIHLVTGERADGER